MRKVKELKRIARGNLTGNYSGLIRAFVFCNLITSLVEMPFSMMTNDIQFSTQNIIYYVATILIGIAAVVLTGGQYRMHLSVARNGQVHPSDLFYPVKYHVDRYIFTELILFIISLVTMIPMIGGLILILTQEDLKYYIAALVLAVVSFILTTYISLTFDLVYFVLNDHEELGMMKALKFTKKLVTTHRKRYLYLQLSFLPMLFLVGISFGTAIFWVQPYMVQTTTVFYLDVKRELDEVIAERQKNEPSPESMMFNEYV